MSYFVDRGPCCTVVRECERVLEPLQCNLTEAWSDTDETYHVRVTALQGSERSSSSDFYPEDGFLPDRDTELQPPVLWVAPCNRSLCVELHSPVPLLHSIYDNFWYELKVESSTAQEEPIPIRSLEKQELTEVIVGSQYCVSVRFADDVVPRNSDFGPVQCVFVDGPINSSAVLPLVLLPVLLLMLLITVTVVIFLKKPLCLKKPTLPSVLTAVLHIEEKLEVSCHPAVSSLLLINPSPPEGLTEDCSSETDSTEDLEDCVEPNAISDEVQYRSQASLCSVEAPAEVTVEGPEEEVDLLTLTFSRDKETDTSASLLSDMAPPACVMAEEQSEPEEDSSEECFQSGYMSR